MARSEAGDFSGLNQAFGTKKEGAKGVNTVVSLNAVWMCVQQQLKITELGTILKCQSFEASSIILFIPINLTDARQDTFFSPWWLFPG